MMRVIEGDYREGRREDNQIIGVGKIKTGLQNSTAGLIKNKNKTGGKN